MLPVVFLPALLCDHELYRAQLAAVGDLATPMVIVVAEASLEKAAATVLARAPERFALVGTSAGGYLALEVVAAAPGRIAGLWLTGVNAGAHADPDGARRLSARVRAGEFTQVVNDLTARCIHVAGPRATDALATLRRMAHRAGPDVFLRQSEAVITRRDRSDVLKTLTVPTLLLWGRHDDFAPAERAHALAADIPYAEVVVLEDCGHLPTLEQPDASTMAAREWLEAVRATAHAT
jgi:pimeloyl-ACP methyl ester carboxylesterase